MTLVDAALLLLAVFLTAAAVYIAVGLRNVPRLTSQPPASTADAPSVSIVVAARDEARVIEPAMRSLLALRYPPSRFEIIAVDDRSTDGTGEILNALAAADPRLRVLRVDELPEGWLGKNHALSAGAAAARGEWLLFTDADVVMEPDALLRAIGYAEARALGHLAVLPEVRVPGILLQAFVTGFVAVGLAALRPWKAKDPRSKRSAGVGAFNLVRRTTYQRVGGHARIRLRPDDDLKLGKILKRSGARADVLSGTGAISVAWYHSMGEAINGLMKNSFAVVEYRSVLMLMGAVFYLVVGLGPLAGLVLGSGLTRWLGAAGLSAVSLLLLWIRAETRTPRRSALLFPVVAALLAWILIRALVLTLSQRGITWRGTFYPLHALRKNRV